jgi:DNA-binding MarR family transcriptional regulator
MVAPATNSYFCSVKNEIPLFVRGEMAPRIGRSAKLITLLIKAQFTANGISLTKEQFVLLMHVEEGPKPQSSLAMITERDKGSLTRLVQSLEKKNYVTRKMCEADGRVNHVKITKKGIDVLNQTKPIVSELFVQLKSGIEEEEKEIALKVLEKILDNATKELEKIENTKK